VINLNYTIINHTARLELGLSIEEYCIADAIYHLANNPQSAYPGWCYMSKDTFAENFGLGRATIFRALDKLLQLGLIKKHTAIKGLLCTTSNWYTTVLIKKEQSQNETTSIKTILGEYQNDTQDSIKMIRYKDIDKDIDKDIFKDKGKNLIKKERLYSLEEITQSDIEEIAEKYHCTPAFVLIQKEKMTNWAEAKGKRYKNYKSALRNWVIIAMEKTIEGRMQGNVRPAIDARGLSRKI